MSDEDRTRWNERYRAEGGPPHPTRALIELADALPPTGPALDVAGGAGRNALWLAARGHEVTLLDVSDVALDLARTAADAANLRAHLRTAPADLERDPLPPGPWNLVVCVHYLQRDLFPALAASLAPGGALFYLQPTVVNLERHARPGPHHLLAAGELRATLAALGLDVRHYAEDWTPEGRHEACALAFRRA